MIDIVFRAITILCLFFVPSVATANITSDRVQAVEDVVKAAAWERIEN